ncbi:MAG: hypothetical protein A2506_12220 [Elusimicrobia bacterium RIFOXYD12_FULL_66_9]|nr:MAG: hypothetical protein A2506_12220 [Elusimicrobia bacterium RIFOXYD12_FULL_66_9]
MALALLAAGARAEAPVGLDAQGVNPMSAVDNRLGLDVRDELGRPVSGRLVLAQLKSAAAARTAENAFTSRLPQARSILPALEMAKGLGTWLAQLAEALPSALAVASLPTPRPKVSALLLIALGGLLASTASVLGPRSQRLSVFFCTCRREVLRC